MGVHGLWELLAPVGHRVSNESVRNKVLAVDVSIWLTQFVKAMRDAEGAQVRNGHLLGVFRRCMKLLYLSVKPVLVFDGATPPLKRRTLSSRRAQREKHAAKLRRLAEKMLLNRIKQRSIDHAIVKNRKVKPQKRSMNLKTNALSSSLHGKYQACESVDPSIHQDKSSHAVSEQALRSHENAEIVGDKSSATLDDITFSDDQHDVTDTDDMRISLPKNLDHLDDEVLMKLPSKLQSEVFKQAKLTQRALHRENMLQEQKRPSEFSRMQIEGFLRHTALNRKISRARSVLNAKSGASHRIASDSKRGFVLTQDTLTETHGHTERVQSEETWEEAESPDAKTGPQAQPDLLAKIRTRKESLKDSTPTIITQRRPLDQHTHVESGNEWASKILEGNGTLYTSPKIPDVTSVECGDQACFNAEKEFHQSCEEQHVGMDVVKKKTHANIDNRGNIVDTDDSDDEEWEDGIKPTSHDFGEEFGEEHIKQDVTTERLHVRSASDKNLELAVAGARSRRERPNFKGSCATIKQHLATYETDQLASRRNSTPSISRHDITQTVSSSVSMQRSPIGEMLYEDHRSLCNGGSAPPEKKLNMKAPVKDLVQFASINSKEGDCSLPLFSDDMCPESQHKPLILRTTKAQKANPPGIREELIELSAFDKSERISTFDRTDQQTSMLRQGSSFTTEALRSSLAEHVIPCKSKEGDDLRTEVEKHNHILQSNELISKHEVQGLESKTSRERFEEKLETIAKDKKSSRSFHPGNNVETESLEMPTQNPANSLLTPRTTEGYSDGANRERMCEASDESEKQERSVAQLECLQKELEAEAREIDRQRSKYRGGADTVADEMYSETRDLIKLLGIPYLEAPMEAEAQCAFLNKEKIVHGVLTEDSDTFLFGAVTVYRHLFAEGRFAEAYEANDIQQCLGLDQNKLIRLAYLLGSDYTSGVRGVGIVNSMEILEAFPGPAGLTEFRDWMKSVTLLDEEPTKEMLMNHSTEAVRRRFCWKHRNMKRNWEVREGFPNSAVFDAYKEPVVDKCREQFSWGSIDFGGLARFCWDKFGWDNVKFEGAVGPLRRKLQETSDCRQRRIDEFFQPHRFAKIRSERLQNAVQGIAGDSSTDLMATKTGAQRRAKPTKRNINTTGCLYYETKSDDV